jgi:hypothetical protein
MVKNSKNNSLEALNKYISSARFLRPFYLFYKKNQNFQRYFYYFYLPNYFFIYLRGNKSIKNFITNLIHLSSIFTKNYWLYKSKCSYDLKKNFSSRSSVDKVFQNVFLIGGSRFGIDKSGHLLFLMGNPYRSPKDLFTNFLVDEEVSGHIKYFKENQSIYLNINHKSEIKYVKGLTVSSLNPNSNNFYHFLVEALFDLMCSINQGIKVDNIIVDEMLSERFLDIIRRIAPKIKIIKIRSFDLVKIENLLVFKDINFHFHWKRSGDSLDLDKRDKQFPNKSIAPNHYFNSAWLINLRDKFTEIFDDISGSDEEGLLPIKSIFLIRKSNIRNTINQEELIKFFNEKFVISIDPSKTTHSDLYSQLSRAKIVFMQSGAAVANALFCRPSTIFVCWQYVGPEQDISLFEDFLSALSIKQILIPAQLKRSAILNDSSTGIADLQKTDVTQADIICPLQELKKITDIFL